MFQSNPFFEEIPAARAVQAAARAVLPETAAELAPLLILLLCLAAIGVARHLTRRRSPRPRRFRLLRGGAARPTGSRAAAPHQNPVSDPATQMAVVARAGYTRTRLLNREEARLLPILEAAVTDFGRGDRLMAQTSLGELLRPIPDAAGDRAQDRAAHAVINSKRQDFAIIDRGGFLVAAIEYMGTGHYHETSFMRDAVKREALRKAGVPMIEVTPDFRPDELRDRIRRVLAPASGPGPRALTEDAPPARPA